MTKEDIITIPITQEMILEAENEASRLKSKWGESTRAAIESRDIIGSLAHQVVEQYIEESGLAFKSYRKEIYKSGDNLDIEYENDKIDVKGTHGELDKYFYNKEFLVFQKQLDNPKTANLTHFLFVLVRPDYKEAYIFGIISVSKFLSSARPVKLKWDNMGIRAYQLRDFRSYLYRV